MTAPPTAQARSGIERLASMVRSRPVDSEADAARLREMLAERAEIRALWEWIRSTVERTGVAVVHDVPLESHAMLLGLTMSLGMPSPVGNGGALIHDVTPSPPAKGADISRTREAFPLHTDSTALAEPHAYLSLACREMEPGAGGATQVLHVDTLRRLLESTNGEACVRALEQPVFPFPLRQPVERDGRIRLADAGVQSVPILSWSNGIATIRYRADILTAGIDELAPRYRSALAALDALLADESIPTSWSLSPGDVLFLDNRRVLHGRSAIGSGARRLLWRVRMTAAAALG